MRAPHHDTGSGALTETIEQTPVYGLRTKQPRQAMADAVPEPETGGITSCEVVVAAKITGADGKSFTVYKMNVVAQDERRWDTAKRFSDVAPAFRPL